VPLEVFIFFIFKGTSQIFIICLFPVQSPENAERRHVFLHTGTVGFQEGGQLPHRDGLPHALGG